jgi:hypothetical protein
MAHTLVITAYKPDFSPEFKKWVKKNINPIMVNISDSEEKSYFLDTIVEESFMLSVEDSSLIAELQNQNVEYVEF